jgi:uncharacterized protein
MADREEPESLRVGLRVRPGAGRTRVGGLYGEDLVVAVTARAVDGKATQAALKALAEALGLRPRQVTLLTGATSRSKVALVQAPGQLERVRARLAELAGP